MSTFSFMPRHGSQEHRRLGLMFLTFFLIAVALAMPDLAFANFKGDFSPDAALVDNTNKSFLAWWKAVAVWGLWISVAALVVSVLFLGGRMWFIPVGVALICLFGESFVNGVKNMMG